MQTCVDVPLSQEEQCVPRSTQAEPAPRPSQSASTLQSKQTAGPEPQKRVPLVVP